MFFYVFKGDGNPVYSPEFSRGGLIAQFGAYIRQVLESPTLTITIEGRSEEDTAFLLLGTFSAITTIGVKASTQTGVPQILRYKFEVSGSSQLSGVAIELLSPVWRDS